MSDNSLKEPIIDESGPRALVYEDDALIGELHKDYLERNGIKADFFSDIFAAKAAAKEHSYDAAWIDVNDSESRPVGLDLAKEFKNYNQDSILVLITSHRDYEQDASRMGAEFFQKPFDKSAREICCGKIAERFKKRFIPMSQLTVTTVIESTDELTASVSFYHATVGWATLDFPISHFPLPLKEGDTLKLSLLLHNGQEICGMQVTGREEIVSLANDIRFEAPETLSDPAEWDAYRAKLAKFFKEPYGP